MKNQMANYLITPTLLNSLKYYLESDFGKREDFLKTLSRERFEPNEAMQKGIDFENDIQKFCKDMEDYYMLSNIAPISRPEESKIIEEVSNIVYGGFWQESVKKEIEVAGTRFLLYGRCDVIKDDTIYDIKYTKNYNLGKFSNSTQHLIYMYCGGLDKFQYLVSDLKNYWTEEYTKPKNIESKIISEIHSLLNYLKRDEEANKLFYSKWKSK